MTTAAAFVDAIDELTETDAFTQEISTLPLDQLESLANRLTWLQTARPAQLPPADYFVWMLMAGRGSGKTRSGAEDVWWPASRTPQRVAVIGPTLADVRKTCFEGESGLLNVVPKRLISSYNRSLCEMWFTNESYFVGYSSEEPDRLRGPQHHRAWCDELAAWRYLEDTWDMMMFGLRLGTNPTVIVTTTPKPVGLIRKLLKESDTILSRESTFANAANLPEKVLAKLREKYDNTRLGRQELYAEVLEDNPYALWSQQVLDKSRHSPKSALPDYRRVVVAVDPPVTSGEDADECGIVGAGIASHEDGTEHAYVHYDWSVQGKSPQGWASRAVSLYHHMRADCIVAEVNQGGDMVEAMIRQTDPKVPVVKVRATRGKVVRAEPVSALYEQKRVHHIGHLPELEDQMCDFTSDFDKDVMGYSPDRVDALVWAITSLMLDDDFEYGMLRAV
jgi:phage terminase large subunit-like protein